MAPERLVDRASDTQVNMLNIGEGVQFPLAYRHVVKHIVNSCLNIDKLNGAPEREFKVRKLDANLARVWRVS
jgi:hypothetical protein